MAAIVGSDEGSKVCRAAKQAASSTGLFKTVAIQGSACKLGRLPSAIVGGTKYEEQKGTTKAATK